MLHAGLIRHTVNKTSFSEQCYYTLAEIVTNPGTLNCTSSDTQIAQKNTHT